jgi:hypothetical protein
VDIFCSPLPRKCTDAFTKTPFTGGLTLSFSQIYFIM